MNTIQRYQTSREQYEGRYSKITGETLNGLEWHEELAGPGGMYLFLFVLPTTTDEEINAAVDKFRGLHDMVDWGAYEIDPAWAEAEKPKLDPNHKGGWIEAARWIIANKTARRLDRKTGELIPKDKAGGIMLDLFSASIMVQVYDRLNEANRAKLDAMPVAMAHHILLQVAK